MSRFLSGLVFFAVVLGTLGAVHLYVWMRLVRDPAWPAPWSRLGTIALVCAGLSLPLGIFVGHRWHGRVGGLVTGAAYTWFSAVFMLALTFANVAPVFAHEAHPDVEVHASQRAQDDGEEDETGEEA